MRSTGRSASTLRQTKNFVDATASPSSRPARDPAPDPIPGKQKLGQRSYHEWQSILDQLVANERQMLADHGAEDGSYLFNRMVFAQQVTALEAYLGDTLFKQVIGEKK